MGSSSIGIIGGADGPTSIIVSSNSLSRIIAVLVVMAIIVGVIVILRKKK